MGMVAVVHMWSNLFKTILMQANIHCIHCILYRVNVNLK